MNNKDLNCSCFAALFGPLYWISFKYKRYYENRFRSDNHWDDNHSMPYFEETKLNNLTSYLGKNAYLPCQIRQLGDRIVSLHLPVLSTSHLTFFYDYVHVQQ